MAIGTKMVCHIAFLTSDIHAAAANWSALLGVPKPEIRYLPGPDEIPCYTNGKPGDYSDCQIGCIELENILLEFVQPGERPGPWRDHMDKHGEGFQHISFVVPDKQKALAEVKAVTGVAPFHAGYYPDSTYIFLDTLAQLGCEINIKADEDNRGRITAYLKDTTAPITDY